MANATEIAALAAGWLIRLEREATPEIWEEFQDWLDSHPRHRAEFIRQRTAWNRVDKLKMFRPPNGLIDSDLISKIEFVDSDEELEPETQPSEPSVTRPNVVRPSVARPDAASPEVATGGFGGFSGGIDLSRHGWLAAAAVAGLAVLGAWYWALQSGWETYQTAIGARQHILLTDGSTVELNTNSELRVRMAPTHRDLVLKRGEALFHVAHDSQRPFFVTAETTVVRAVGTAFSVRIREDNRVEVLVTEGRVAVGSPETTETQSLPVAAAAASTGEAAFVNHGTVSVRHMRTDDMARKLAWTEGHLAFLGETLTEAVGEFNRYNLRHLSIGDRSINEMHVGGTFSSTDPDSFVAALELKFHVAALPAADGSGVRLIAAPEARSDDTIKSLEEAPARTRILPRHDPQRTQDSIAR